MLKKTLLIVSDKFYHFSTRNDVITKSQLYHLLNTEDLVLPSSEKIRLIPGQGFSDNAINELLVLASTAKNTRHFDFTLWRSHPKRAPKKLPHKHNNENILVSQPKRITKDEFNMHMLIDEKCEMMRDHQTGLHVQGMLLVEAARQAYLATMESFYMENNKEKHYFIFNSLTINYNRFSFPLPSSIKLTTEKLEVLSKKRTDTLTKIELIQCGETSASVLMDVTIMPSNRVSNMENRLADQSLNNHINYLLNEQVFNEVANA
jgi:hypothetical protein